MMSDVARRQRCAASGREADASMLSRSAACPMPACSRSISSHFTQVDKAKQHRAALRGRQRLRQRLQAGRSTHTCKSIEGSAAQHRGCQAGRGCHIGGSLGQRSQNVLQQQRLSCACAHITPLDLLFLRADKHAMGINDLGSCGGEERRCSSCGASKITLAKGLKR